MRISELIYFVFATVASPARRRGGHGHPKVKQTRGQPKIHLSIESAEGQLIFPEHLPRRAAGATPMPRPDSARPH